MRDIGSQVRGEGIRTLGAKKEGKECMYFVILGSEEDKYEVIEKKKLFKGKSERMNEVLTWRERRRKSLHERKAWAEGSKDIRVRIGRDRMWLNGEI